MMRQVCFAGVVRVALGAVAAVILASGASAQKRGGSVTLGLELDIPGFDPLKVGVYDTAASSAAALIFDTLVTLDDAGRAAPKLAQSWSHSDDYKTWTFNLRPDVKFQDGTAFDARAVAWNYARQKDPANHCRCAFYIQGIDKVEAADERTVVFRLRDSSVEFPSLLAPPTANNVAQSPTAVEKLGEDYNHHPVGTGPFMMKSWTAGDRMVLERNPDYWDKNRPYLDRVVLRPLPDGQARFASLQSGDTDVIWDDPFDGDNILRAEKNPALSVHSYTGSGATVYAFNTRSAPFDDLRVRQALVMAVDLTRMSQAVSSGIAKPATNPFGDGSWVKCRDDGALPYDPVRAKELLKEYGKPVTFKMIATATPRGRMVGQVFQQFWKQVGAEMEIEQVDQTSVVTRAFTRQFQLTPWRIVDLADPDPQMFANFHTGSPVALANYSNPELDRLLEHARVTADQAARSEDYCAATRLINREAIWFWTFQNTYFAIAKKQLKGLPKLYSNVVDLSGAWLE